MFGAGASQGSTAQAKQSGGKHAQQGVST